jgi:hypothetical protein
LRGEGPHPYQRREGEGYTFASAIPTAHNAKA